MNMLSLRSLFVLTLMLPACSTAVTRESFVPIPQHTASVGTDPRVRGRAADAGVLEDAEQLAIAAEIAGRFYRPMMQHARWVDSRPLAHERSRAADSAVADRPDWSLGIVEATGLDRVCPDDFGNGRCAGRAGGVLRFSRAYAVGAHNTRGADSALMYVQYTPRGHGIESEIEFFVVRAARGWRIASLRTMPEMLAALPDRRLMSPEELLQSLLDADRAFAAAARDSSLAAALTTMFVANVSMNAPRGFIRGRDSARAHLAAGPDAAATITWTPIKGGVSSDGEHGFTVGYTTLTRPDGSTVPGKYVAYWVYGETGWRIAAYRRAPRAAAGPATMLPPSLPTRGLARGDAATVQRYADELSAAEHAFSREAQSIGLGPAFAKYGAPDAVNAGGPGDTNFVVGPEAIAHAVSAGMTPEVTIEWGPERVIVATTGDLGVSIGTIRITAPGADGTRATRAVPFFTIWKRAYPGDPWRYVAE